MPTRIAPFLVALSLLAITTMVSSMEVSSSANNIAYWRPIGIRNIGNTCYLGTSIRTLFMLAPIRNTLMTLRKNASPDAKKRASNGLDVAIRLGKAMRHMMCRSTDIYDPFGLVFALEKVPNRPYELQMLRRQHDLDTFLWTFLVNSHMLQSSTSPLLQSVVDGLFGFDEMSVLSNPEYPGIESSTLIRNHEVRLELSGNACESVQSCWRSSFHHIVESNFDKQTKDGENVEAVKQQTMMSAPEVLVLKIDRGYTYTNNQVDYFHAKDLRNVTFEDRINVREFVAEDCTGETEYELAMVHMHQGHHYQVGHTYMFARDLEHQRWIKFDDSQYTYVPEHEVKMPAALNPFNTPSALIYVRVDKFEHVFGRLQVVPHPDHQTHLCGKHASKKGWRVANSTWYV